MLANHYARGGPDFVSVDNRGGCRELTTHLIRVHGYADLAFLAGPADSPDSAERFAGFCEALRQADLPVPGSPAASGEFTEASGRRAVAALLAEGHRPRAIVCGNDEMALGALTALRAARLRVPADVAVTGFDDITVARHVRPALTTVRQPMYELGEQSIRLLLARIADRAAPRKSVELPTQVVVRRSCGCRNRPATKGLAPGHERRKPPPGEGPAGGDEPQSLPTSSSTGQRRRA